MARIRTVKPTFFTSSDTAQLTFSARLTFIGLWTYCDDEGRGVDDTRLVKGAIWPLDDKHGLAKIEADLALLAKRGHIQRYAANGRRYLRVVEWQHQRINRPTSSILPAPVTELAVKAHGDGSEDSHTEGNREKGIGNREVPPPPVSEEPLAGPEPVGGDFDQRINDAARLLAEAECERRGGEIGNPEGYIRSRVAPIRAQNEGAWRLILDAHPSTTPEQLARSDEPPTPLDATGAAQAALMDRNRRRNAGEVCPACEDSGVVEQEDGTYEDCECKYRATA